MNGPENLTDRTQLRRNRLRAARQGIPADFLLKQSALELQERLDEVNRTFTAPAIVSGFPDFWRDFLPEAKIVADDPVLDLTPGEHDLVIHALSLHWSEDPVGQMIQCRRAAETRRSFSGDGFSAARPFLNCASAWPKLKSP